MSLSIIQVSPVLSNEMNKRMSLSWRKTLKEIKKLGRIITVSYVGAYDSVHTGAKYKFSLKFLVPEVCMTKHVH